MNEQKSFHPIIIGVALIFSATIFGCFYYFGQFASNKDVLSVTGSAKTQIISDQAKLIISLSRIANDDNLASGYKAIVHDLILTKDLLKNNNVENDNIMESPISMNQIYDQNNSDSIRYQLNQSITIQLDDVNKVTDISKKIPELASQGVIVSIQSLEYFYSKLPDLRVSLLTQATQDAKARAEKIAESTGRQIGNIQSASSGVVQVLTPNSVDISDYGSYDTSSIQKDVMVTIKASFRLK